MKGKRLTWVIAALLVLTGITGVVTAVVLGPQSVSTIEVLQIELTDSGFPAKVSPGGVYYFNVTARSSYATDTSGVFITVTLDAPCVNLAGKFSLAEKSATYGGYAPLTGADTAGGTCTFTNVGITATVPAGRIPVVYWFRETVTSALPDLTWSLQAARQK